MLFIFSVYFYKFNRIRSDFPDFGSQTQTLGLARLSSSAGRSLTNIKVRTQSPLNLGSGAQNGNVHAV